MILEIFHMKHYQNTLLKPKKTNETMLKKGSAFERLKGNV